MNSPTYEELPDGMPRAARVQAAGVQFIAVDAVTGLVSHYCKVIKITINLTESLQLNSNLTQT